jgi:hypothetical protein
VRTFSTLVDGSFPATSAELRASRGKLVNENGERFSGG